MDLDFWALCDGGLAGTFSSEGALDFFGGSLISALLLHSESSGEMSRFMSWR
jgi:hypothetical protein